MVTSTNANIGYGIILEEGYNFPWDKKKYDRCYLTWWRKINKFKNPYEWKVDHAKAFDFEGKWEEKFPIPFEVENYCSDECEMFALLVPGTTLVARRGYPETFNPNELKVPEESLNRFIKFLKDYKIDYIELKWLLFSYWG